MEEKQELSLYIVDYNRVACEFGGALPVCISVNHLIMICKNVYKICEVRWFLLPDKVL